MRYFKEFPQDNKFYLLRWYDKMEHPYKFTESASILLQLQPLNVSDIQEVAEMRSEDVARLLTEYRNFEVRRVHIGSYPLLSIGCIFRNGQYVGQLPTKSFLLIMPQGDKHCGSHVVGEYVNAKARTSSSPLLPEEYGGLSTYFAQSRYLTHEQGRTTYIIPVAEITRVFYAPHTELAKVFCQGQWNILYKKLIFEGKHASGLATEEIAEGLSILLRHQVPREYAVLLANFYFNTYGKESANKIYWDRCKDWEEYKKKYYGDVKIEGKTKLNTTWFASGRIPFEYKTNSLELACDGVVLQSTTGHRKVLVTCIHGSTIPNEMQAVFWGKDISGDKGAEIVRSPDHVPFAGTPESRYASEQAAISAEQDAYARTGAVSFNGMTFSWINQPKITKLKKPKSTTHDDPTLPPRDTSDPDETSTGEHLYSQGLLTIAQARTLIHHESNQFSKLLASLEIMEEAGSLKCQVYPPSESSLINARGSVPCWNFFTAFREKSNRYAKCNSWRLLDGYVGRRSGVGLNGRSIPLQSEFIPRAALILRFTIEDLIGYWIEIEARHSEQGFKSIFIYDLPNGVDLEDIIERSLEEIARKSGKTPGDAVKEVLSRLSIDASVAGFTHRSEMVDGTHTSIISVEALTKLLDACYDRSDPSHLVKNP